MKRFRHQTTALQNTLYEYLDAKRKPVPMVELQALAKRNGFTASDARLQLHTLSEIDRVEYGSDPTAVTVMVKGVE